MILDLNVTVYIEDFYNVGIVLAEPVMPLHSSGLNLAGINIVNTYIRSVLVFKYSTLIPIILQVENGADRRQTSQTSNFKKNLL